MHINIKEEKLTLFVVIIFLCLLTVSSSVFIEYAYSSSNKANDTTISYLVNPTKLDIDHGMILFPYLLKLVNASSNYLINDMQCALISQEIDSETKNPINIFGIHSFNCFSLVVFQEYPLPDNFNINGSSRIGTFSFENDAIYKIVSFQHLLNSTNIFNIKNLTCGLIGFSNNNNKWDILPINCNMILMFFKNE